jgi:putative membrane protein
MKTLVICVDRDDDLGVKASISGPVIGRQENLNAAQKLGLADPEDVDTNAILSAVALYDDLVKKGIEAEVVTITGDEHVDYRADLILSRQLDNVLELVKPDRAILVSDGEEDEYSYPIISSRIKIDSVKRVFMKQSESLEGFYYLLMKSLKDVKVRTKWVLPLSLILMVFGILMLILGTMRLGTDLGAISQIAVAFILLFLGIYFIWWAFEYGKKARRIARMIRQGSLSIPFALVAIMLFIVGIFLGFDSVSAYMSSVLPTEVSYAIVIVLFVQASTWPIVLGLFSYESGKAITSFLHANKLRWSSIIGMLSVLAIGFIIQGVADSVYCFLVQESSFEPLLIYAEIITGVMVAIFGAVLSASLKGELKEERPQDKRETGRS